MAFIIIIIALVLYFGLYLLWESANISLDGPEAFLRSINNALFMPDNVVFLIFRGLLVLTIFYFVADYFTVKIKGARRKARQRETEIKDLTPTFVEKSDHGYRD